MNLKMVQIYKGILQLSNLRDQKDVEAALKVALREIGTVNDLRNTVMDERKLELLIIYKEFTQVRLVFANRLKELTQPVNNRKNTEEVPS